jgi:hypothetical protein
MGGLKVGTSSSAGSSTGTKRKMVKGKKKTGAGAGRSLTLVTNQCGAVKLEPNAYAHALERAQALKEKALPRCVLDPTTRSLPDCMGEPVLRRPIVAAPLEQMRRLHPRVDDLTAGRLMCKDNLRYDMSAEGELCRGVGQSLASWGLAKARKESQRLWMQETGRFGCEGSLGCHPCHPCAGSAPLAPLVVPLPRQEAERRERPVSNSSQMRLRPWSTASGSTRIVSAPRFALELTDDAEHPEKEEEDDESLGGTEGFIQEDEEEDGVIDDEINRVVMNGRSRRPSRGRYQHHATRPATANPIHNVKSPTSPSSTPISPMAATASSRPLSAPSQWQRGGSNHDVQAAAAPVRVPASPQVPLHLRSAASSARGRLLKVQISESRRREVRSAGGRPGVAAAPRDRDRDISTPVSTWKPSPEDDRPESSSTVGASSFVCSTSASFSSWAANRPAVSSSLAALESARTLGLEDAELSYAQLELESRRAPLRGNTLSLVEEHFADLCLKDVKPRKSKNRSHGTKGFTGIQQGARKVTPSAPSSAKSSDSYVTAEGHMARHFPERDCPPASALALEQRQEVHAVLDALARSGLSISSQTLERALLIPEDRPVERMLLQQRVIVGADDAQLPLLGPRILVPIPHLHKT